MDQPFFHQSLLASDLLPRQLRLYFQVIGALHWGLHPDYDVWLTSYPDWLWQTITAVHLGSIAVIYVALLQKFVALTVFPSREAVRFLSNQCLSGGARRRCPAGGIPASCHKIAFRIRRKFSHRVPRRPRHKA